MTRPAGSKQPFQPLPRPPTPGNIGRALFTPSQNFLNSRYGDDLPGVRAFMAWSIAAGLAYAANRQPDPPEGMDPKGAGRGLWTWEDCVVVGSPDHPALSYIKEQALRPTAAFPSDLRSISPRLAAELLGGNYSAVKRMVEAMGYQLPNAMRLDQVFGLVGYGDLQDGALPLFGRVRSTLPAIPGFSKNAAYLAHVCDDLEPFAVGILRHTLFEVDLAPRLLAGRVLIEAKCRALYESIGAFLDDDFSRSYTAVLDRVMREEWHLEEFDPEDPEPDYEQVLERLVIWQWHDNRCLPAGLFMGLSMLTGVSPASFTAYAVSDARRRGYTFIDVAEVDKLAGKVEDASMSSAAARCAKEIRGHSDELKDILVGKQGVAERLARVSRARQLKDVFWEFADRFKEAAA